MIFYSRHIFNSRFRPVLCVCYSSIVIMYFSCPSCSFCDFLSSCSALLAVSLSSVSQTWKHPWTVAALQTVLIAHCSAVATEPSLLFLLQSCLASSKTGSFHLWAAAVYFMLTYFLALLHIMSWYLCFLALHIISCILMSCVSVFFPILCAFLFAWCYNNVYS